MCATCGCGELDHEEMHARGIPHEHDHGHVRRVQMEVDLLAKNDAVAAENRSWLSARGIAAVNLMSSPGSGKTTLLEQLLTSLPAPAVVIEGDQETEADADRIRATGRRSIQINTGAGCHLDAAMVRRAMEEVHPPRGSLLFIENVGNLVCPALFDLGEGSRLVVASVTEGDDKPFKYPHMFRTATALVLNKIDLLPHVRFDVDRFVAGARRAHPGVPIFPVSALHGQGMDALAAHLLAQLPELAEEAVP